MSKHRFFTFLDAGVAPDETIVAVATDDPYLLGVLSARPHQLWALAAGTRLGVGNDPRYNNSRTFDSYPFPSPDTALRGCIGALAERIERHRQDAIRRSPKVTMTALDNVLDRLRAGEPLSAPQRELHTVAACGVLADLHDELDRIVAQSYGWEMPAEDSVILERLVMLHILRTGEEESGRVHWLRPEYQLSRFARDADDTAPGLALNDHVNVSESSTVQAWPPDAVGQITALRQMASTAPVSVDEAVASFAGAPRSIIARHLETLAILGEVRPVEGGPHAAAVTAA